MMIPCIFLTKPISSKLFLAPGVNRESELDVSSSGIDWLRCPQCCRLQEPRAAAQPTAGLNLEFILPCIPSGAAAAAPVPAREREGGVCVDNPV